jgi:hypothetical protein
MRRDGLETKLHILMERSGLVVGVDLAVGELVCHQVWVDILHNVSIVLGRHMLLTETTHNLY